MDLRHGKYPLPPSLHLANCPEVYTDKRECHFSIMEDTNKELWVRRLGHNTRIYCIYKGELVESSQVLKFSSPKNSALDLMQKIIFLEL